MSQSRRRGRREEGRRRPVNRRRRRVRQSVGKRRGATWLFVLPSRRRRQRRGSFAVARHTRRRTRGCASTSRDSDDKDERDGGHVRRRGAERKLTRTRGTRVTDSPENDDGNALRLAATIDPTSTPKSRSLTSLLGARKISIAGKRCLSPAGMRATESSTSKKS